MKRNRNRKIVSLIAIACVFVIGGTLAYLSDYEQADNTFTIGHLTPVLEEEFTPPSDWQPGVEVKKAVGFNNTSSNVDAVFVAKFEETAVRSADVVVKEYDDAGDKVDKVVAKAGEVLPTIFNIQDSAFEEVGVKNLGTSVVPYRAGESMESYKNKWVYFKKRLTKSINGKTYDTCEYYFVYAGVVPAGQKSPLLLESVTLNKKLGSTVKGSSEHAFVTENGESKKTLTYEISELGYDSVEYHLIIQARSLQATKSAVQDEWIDGRKLAADPDDNVPVQSLIPTDVVPEELLLYVKSLCKTNSAVTK